jgi:hypothetical protein
MQTREGNVRAIKTERLSPLRRRHGLVGPLAAALAIAVCVTTSPAQADFVCNAKTRLVNVFLNPPSYWAATIPQEETALEMRDRVLEEQRRAARGPGYWSPADAMKEPFDLVDTLPSGTRIKVNTVTGLRESKGDWLQISFRHTQTGLVAQGWVHESQQSPIRCDVADPETNLGWIEVPDGPGEPKGYRARLEDNFELTVGEPPHEGARTAKQFDGKPPQPEKSKVITDCQRPPETYALPKPLTLGSDLVDPYVLACTKALNANPHYLKAIIIRGDLFHRFAKTPAGGIDSKSPNWADDVNRRKAAQQRAIADWAQASKYVPKNEVPILLGDRLAPSGAASYQVK